MSGYTPATKTAPRYRRATPRTCGLTRRELRNLRALSGCQKPHKCITWLKGETRLAQWGDGRVKRLAFAFAGALSRVA